MKGIYRSLAGLTTLALGVQGCVTVTQQQYSLPQKVNETSERIIVPSKKEIDELAEESKSSDNRALLRKWYGKSGEETFYKGDSNSPLYQDMHRFLNNKGVAGAWFVYDPQKEKFKKIILPTLDGLRRALDFYNYAESPQEKNYVDKVIEGEVIRMLKLQETLSSYVDTYNRPFEHHIIAIEGKNKGGYVIHVYDNEIDDKLPVEVITYFNSLKLKELQDMEVDGLAIKLSNKGVKDTSIIVKHKNHRIITNPITSFIAYSTYPLIVGSNYVPWSVPFIATGISAIQSYSEIKNAIPYQIYALRIQQKDKCEVTNLYSLFASHAGLELAGVKPHFAYKYVFPLKEGEGMVVVESSTRLNINLDLKNNYLLAVNEENKGYETLRTAFSKISREALFAYILKEITDELESKSKERKTSHTSKQEGESQPSQGEEPQPYNPPSPNGLIGPGSGTDEGGTTIVPGLISYNPYFDKKLEDIEKNFGVKITLKG